MFKNWLSRQMWTRWIESGDGEGIEKNADLLQNLATNCEIETLYHVMQQQK